MYSEDKQEEVQKMYFREFVLYIRFKAVVNLMLGFLVVIINSYNDNYR